MVDLSKLIPFMKDSYRVQYLKYENSLVANTDIIDLTSELEMQHLDKVEAKRETLKLQENVARNAKKAVTSSSTEAKELKKIKMTLEERNLSESEVIKSTLTYLNDFFMSYYERRHFKIYNFYETQKVKRVAMIVDEEAAKLRKGTLSKSTYVPQSTAMPNVDHLSICKFVIEDDNYKKVLGCLTTMTEHLFPDEVKKEKTHQAALKVALEQNHDEGFLITLLDPFPFAAETADWPATAPLFVDVGCDEYGSKCRDLIRAHNAAWGRLIKQCLPHSVKRALPEPGVRMMAQDPFEPQQVRDAKFYYLRDILYHQSDTDTRRILTQLRPALTPGAAVLVDEVVKRPSSNKERTQLQWEELFRSANFRIETIYDYKFSKNPDQKILKIVPIEE